MIIIAPKSILNVSVVLSFKWLTPSTSPLETRRRNRSESPCSFAQRRRGLPAPCNFIRVIPIRLCDADATRPDRREPRAAGSRQREWERRTVPTTCRSCHWPHPLATEHAAQYGNTRFPLPPESLAKSKPAAKVRPSVRISTTVMPVALLPEASATKPAVVTKSPLPCLPSGIRRSCGAAPDPSPQELQAAAVRLRAAARAWR